MAYITVGTLLVALAAVAQWRNVRTADAAHPASPTEKHRDAARLAWQQLRPLILRLPVALLAATLLAALLPAEWIARVFGEAAGASGVVTASVLGAILPGGPMVAFPLAIALFEAGAGTAQMIALITAWAVLAVHRIIAFEAPMAGMTFVVGRLAATAVTPFVAGFLALWLL